MSTFSVNGISAFQADASERLRQSGISHLHPHPVLITQTRSCPLEPPPPPEIVPAWKLIRPKKKKPAPTDEPVGKMLQSKVLLTRITVFEFSVFVNLQKIFTIEF